MAAGLAGYALVPTVPPWMASAPPYRLIPPIDRVAARVYGAATPTLMRVFDTNPVAAMPSLHAAFPLACVLTGWQVFGARGRVGAALYAGSTVISAVYLGEHYAV